MKKVLLILLFLLFLIIIPVNKSFGAGLVPCGPGTAKLQCDLCDFFGLAKNIYIFLLIPDQNLNGYAPLIPIIAGLMLVIGGFMYIIAFTGVEPGLLEKAHTLFKSVIFGLIIIYGAHVFISLLFTIIGWNFPAWNTICNP